MLFHVILTSNEGQEDGSRHVWGSQGITARRTIWICESESSLMVYLNVSRLDVSRRAGLRLTAKARELGL
jgi:hypothetical protein